MLALRNRVPAVAIAAVALLCLTGSSRAFITQVEGSLANTVSFHFYRLPGDGQRVRLRIVEFVVQEGTGQGEWTTVWELKGKRSLDTITYGLQYEGLSEVVRAKPLSRGTQYRALVSERSWLRPTGYSTVYFEFESDERGVVSTNEPR